MEVVVRSDMAQVLIERPRYGSRDANYRRQRRRKRRGDLAESPKFEAIHRREAGQDKNFNDLFGPVIRFLERNVGRPWNKVYSEICTQNDLRNVAQRHLRHHVFDFVTIHVEIRDGEVYDRGRSHGCRLGGGRGSLYVCPNTGLLKRVEPRPKTTGVGDRICKSKELQYHRIQGIWYEVVLRPIPNDRSGCFDALIGKPVAEFYPGEGTAKYGHGMYALSSRALRKKEGRELVKKTKQTKLRKRSNR